MFLFYYFKFLFSAEGEEEGGIHYVVFSSWRSPMARAFPPPPVLTGLDFSPTASPERKPLKPPKAFVFGPEKGPISADLFLYCTQSWNAPVLRDYGRFVFRTHFLRSVPELGLQK